MAILTFLIHVFSAAMLLLFSVRFLRVGIERLWLFRIQQDLGEGSSTIGGLTRGVFLGFIMQGATAVILLAGSLAGSGAIAVPVAAIVALGAELGSALAVQFLHLQISAIAPLAILIGALLYLRAQSSTLHNVGRIVLGIGLIFLSLTLIRASVVPITEMAGTTLALEYLNQDLVTAAIAGSILTLLMYSSVAAILTVSAFAMQAGLTPEAGIAFMLGCNFGSAILPLWITKGENRKFRAVVLSVSTIRCIATVIGVAVLIALRFASVSPPLPDSQSAILIGHLVFNLGLMGTVTLCIALARYFATLGGSTASYKTTDHPGDDLGVALTFMKRETSRMLEMTSSQFDATLRQPTDHDRASALNIEIKASLAAVRDVYANLPAAEDLDMREHDQIMQFAIRIARCGNVLADKFTILSDSVENGDRQFSKAGMIEIQMLIAAVFRAVTLSQETVWTGNADIASQLVRHKQKTGAIEIKSRSEHLIRLRSGNIQSLKSSDQHLEVIATLKEINSKLATIGYAVLDHHGGLKKTRLRASFMPEGA